MAIEIRLAEPADVDTLDTGLRALAAVLGDPHRATPDGLGVALFGPGPIARAVVAWDRAHRSADPSLAGLALFSPLYSTARGLSGAYVSDLWVAEGARGGGVGRRLLAGVRDAAADIWGAGFLRLGVYARTPRARAFYDRLGFVHDPEETFLTLSGAALSALADPGGDHA